MPSTHSSLTRRRWLQTTLGTGVMAGVGAQLGFSSAGLFATEGPALAVEEIRTISWKAPLYHGWPTLTQRRNGELLLVFSGGRESHVCPFGRVELMRSQDDGRTWRWPQVLLDGPIDDRDAGITETASGSLLVTTFTSLAYAPLLEKAEKIPAGQPGAWEAVKLAEWQAVHRRITDDQRRGELGTWMIRSTNGGVTWSARYPVPVNSPHGPTVLHTGQVLYAGVELWKPARRVGFCLSGDDGQTWNWLADLPTRPGDKSSEYHELHAAEAADGSILCHIRNHNPQHAQETLQSRSTDGGKTWSMPESIGVWGLPSHLLRLRDGRLMMSYSYRRSPFGCQVRISENNGQTWGPPLPLYTEGIGGDLGYPSTVQCADGSFVTVWYEKLKDKPEAQLRQARWKLTS